MTWLDERWLKQTATYWAPTSTRDLAADPTFASPTALSVRWVWKAMRFTTPDNQEVVSQAIVWVAQDLLIGGYLYYGSTVTASPYDVTRDALNGPFPILQIKKVPNVDNTDEIFKALL